MKSYLFQDCELYEDDEEGNRESRRYNFEYTNLSTKERLDFLVSRHKHNTTYFKAIYSDEDLII